MWEIWYGLDILDVSTLCLILGGSAIATQEILVTLVMHIERKKQLFGNKIDRG
jgi:hypothetical protein